MRRRTLLLVTLLLAAPRTADLAFAGPATAPTTAPTFGNLTADEFERLAADKTKVILDVRTPREYAAGHIAGSVNIDVNAPDFDQRIAALTPDKTYLVYCATGRRSVTACTRLVARSLPHCQNLLGGIRAWETAGKPTEK